MNGIASVILITINYKKVSLTDPMRNGRSYSAMKLGWCCDTQT